MEGGSQTEIRKESGEDEGGNKDVARKDEVQPSLRKLPGKFIILVEIIFLKRSSNFYSKKKKIAQ